MDAHICNKNIKNMHRVHTRLIVVVTHGKERDGPGEGHTGDFSLSFKFVFLNKRAMIVTNHMKKPPTCVYRP